MDKIKYFQVNDYESMDFYRKYYEKFGYKAVSLTPVEDRDAVEVTYRRDDKKPNSAKFAEYEERYTDALNAVEFADAYENFDPDKHLTKRVSFGTIAVSVLAIIFCGLFLVAFGCLGGAMLYKPEVAESFLEGNGSLTVNGEQYVVDRNLNVDLQGALDAVGIKAITWDLIAYAFLVLAGVMAIAVVLVLYFLIKSKISRVRYNKSEKLRYAKRLEICRSAALEAESAMADIDSALKKLKTP